MKAIAGLFERYEQAEQAVNELYDLGFSSDDVSVVARDVVVRERVIGGGDIENESMAEGAIGGTAIGGIGGLLVGIAAVSVPGIGPVLTAGAVATALGTTVAGAGLGAATGGLIGALAASGIPRDEAEVYVEGVKRGGVLVLVEASDTLATEASSVMSRAGAVDINVRREQWRQSGWQRFDETALPGSDYPSLSKH